MYKMWFIQDHSEGSYRFTVLCSATRAEGSTVLFIEQFMSSLRDRDVVGDQITHKQPLLASGSPSPILPEVRERGGGLSLWMSPGCVILCLCKSLECKDEGRRREL